MKRKKSTWLKNRGYLHLSPQINVHLDKYQILSKVNDSDFVAKHAFFPLIHTNIRERRYKKISQSSVKRSHTKSGKSTAKLRPIHYSTHIDSMIFGFYAEKLQKEYKIKLESYHGLSECVTAYRKIEDPTKKGKYKSTIHFAYEAFSAIKDNTNPSCGVLKFDIESFFSSIDHDILKKAWIGLIKQQTLPPDHYAVYKAATQFSYILKDDLRLHRRIYGRKAGFDEKKLAEIRKTGIVSFFQSNAELRNAFRSGELKVYKNPFRNDKNNLMGIPQGLPISALLANLYLFDFDKVVYDTVVKKSGGFYRRYSDDIIIVCKEEELLSIKQFIIDTITLSNVKISPEKTEQFIFKNIEEGGTKRIVSQKIEGHLVKDNYPFTYLGFGYDGDKILIKSSNIAKFYRRMVFAVKSRSRRAILSSTDQPFSKDVLYKRRLYRLYTNIDLSKSERQYKLKKLVLNRFGEYVFQSEKNTEKDMSNYFSYVRRASTIMSMPVITNQVSRHRLIFNTAINKHLKKNRNWLYNL